MLFLWILIGSGLLYFFQKWLFRKFWDRGLSVSLRFESAAVTEGDLVVLKERSENRKWLPLPMFQYEYTLCRNFAAVTENDAKPIVLRRRLALPGLVLCDQPLRQSPSPDFSDMEVSLRH